MIQDQANDLRRLVRQALAAEPSAPARPLRVVVAGGKGGVGTTSMALCLATSLAQRRLRVVLVDADPDGGSIGILCELEEPFTLADVLTSRRTVRQSLQAGPCGISVLGGAWGLDLPWDGGAAGERLLEQLDSLGDLAEVIVIDAGNNTGRMARRFWQAADQVVVVTTPETASVMNAFTAIKHLATQEPPVALRVLVNMAPDAATAEEVSERLARTCQRFLGLRPANAGYVPWVAPQGTPGQSALAAWWTARSGCPPACSLEGLVETLATRLSPCAVA